jgi:UDP-N-acetylmuramyl pentapeptide phosphotransferase/UDP-N-acetylglucosamine-1-phosphate transferase
MSLLWSLGASFALSCAGTWAVLRRARAWGALDHPNERSAHQRPTPTLGGVGVVAGVWGALALGLAAGPLESRAAWPLLAGSALLLGSVRDDLGHPLSVPEKLALLLLACGAWLWCGPRLEWLALPGGNTLALGPWGWPLTVLWFLWLCNVYNFMDGIDGISGIQALGAGAWIALWTWDSAPSLAWTGLALAGAGAGFLVFNRPPARIFLGDVGALCLGFWLAGLGVLGERAGLPLWIMALPLGCYLYDTTYTLARRLLRGENVLRAHNLHLYQRLARAGWSHLQVDLGLSLLVLLLGGAGQAFLQGATSCGLLLLGAAALILALATGWIEKRVPLD